MAPEIAMKIKVFTDLRFTSHPRQTGVGKHIEQMVMGLAAIPGNEVSVLVPNGQEDDYRNGTLASLPAINLPLSWKAGEALWALTGHPRADRWVGECDWIYSPKNDFLPVRRNKSVVTVHGAHELDPDFPQPTGFSAALNRARRRLSYRRILNQSSLVLTVSNFLKSQMVEWFNVSPDKISVVGNGVENCYFEAAHLSPGCSGRSDYGKFVLCVGGLNFLDGGDRMLALAQELDRRSSDIRVVIAGADHEPALLEMSKGVRNLELLGYMMAPKLSRLMRDALLLYYPSRYETFGIAAVEAMAVGIPIVASSATAIPEVLSDAGIYINPDDVEDSAEVVSKIAIDCDLRTKLRRLAMAKAPEHSWARCVERLNSALRAQ